MSEIISVMPEFISRTEIQLNQFNLQTHLLLMLCNYQTEKNIK